MRVASICAPTIALMSDDFPDENPPMIATRTVGDASLLLMKLIVPSILRVTSSERPRAEHERAAWLRKLQLSDTTL